MSALAKPFIHPVNTINGQGDPLNVEEVATFNAVTAETNNGNYSGPDKFVINFIMKSTRTENTRGIQWRYADQAAMDTDYASILALVSAAV